MLAMGTRLTIGELSRRTGVAVKTLRFYSDRGLLPPAARSASGYRLYTERDVAVVDLVRTLRDAGVGLPAIGRVLARDLPLENVLRLRLEAIEAHVVSLERVAAALRVAIRTNASEDALRRIAMVTKLSNAGRRKMVERFFEGVMSDAPMEPAWIEGMIDASVPELPDDPTPEQLDAWTELATLMADESFVVSMREQAKNSWSSVVDQKAMREAQGVAARAAGDARARGSSPESEEARAIALRFFADVAAAGGTPRHDPRADRYWALISVMKGIPTAGGGYDDWRWLGAAMRHHGIG